MENIDIQRGTKPFAAIADQKNGNWLLTIAEDEQAVFYRKNGEGLLVDTEIHTRTIDKATLLTRDFAEPSGELNLDFTVEKRGDKFFANLSNRAVAGESDSEHGAIRVLINACVNLACAGSLDTTGVRAPGSPRRYDHYSQ